ncbi:expressed unknown protein [Seminavis robusta]|uniref:Uncharacterized protein n=1 Tax=Seminavis robusta TaxID=568900 RepID=A0A9N8F512_9STRA|nr:expressed unknown protein [Seminavis robusta]|eukprot:Sro3941_g352021.1  (102) ;mRNA; r:1011-1316
MNILEFRMNTGKVVNYVLILILNKVFRAPALHERRNVCKVRAMGVLPHYVDGNLTIFPRQPFLDILQKSIHHRGVYLRHQCFRHFVLGHFLEPLGDQNMVD